MANESIPRTLIKLSVLAINSPYTTAPQYRFHPQKLPRDHAGSLAIRGLIERAGAHQVRIQVWPILV